MKLELLDAYNIRARLSSSIILLAPIAVTVFLCFEDMTSFASSSALIGFLLAFTNYIPTLQRRIRKKEPISTNYAAQLLSWTDNTIDSVSKKRFYSRLAKIDPTFLPFESPDDSDAFRNCCDSAVVFLRTHTRDNRLVQEENINYGFCKNLISSKPLGIVLSLTFCIITIVYSLLAFKSLSAIPVQNYLAFSFNFAMLLFWAFGITQQFLEISANYYAKALIASIDSLKI